MFGNEFSQVFEKVCTLILLQSDIWKKIEEKKKERKKKAKKLV